MKFNLIKTLVTGLTISVFLFSTAYAKEQKNTDDENIDVTQQQITHEELAAIYVLSDLCPKLVKDKKQFETGYAKLVHDYMPGQKNAVETLEKLSKEKSFKSVLKEARLDAKKAGDQENTEVCEDVSGYNS